MSSHEKIEMKAQCLCGAVRITAKQANLHAGVCHCGMCRRWGGGPFFALNCGVDVSFEGADNISVFDSSEWAERGFCKHCGSHLFYRLKKDRRHMIPAGLFERAAADAKVTLDHQVFIDEKPAYYAFANQTTDMTGAEIFAKFAPK
ncbi:MAG: GFA family protein [Gammaproteobacteria bacterium]